MLPPFVILAWTLSHSHSVSFLTVYNLAIGRRCWHGGLCLLNELLLLLLLRDTVPFLLLLLLSVCILLVQGVGVDRSLNNGGP